MPGAGSLAALTAACRLYEKYLPTLVVMPVS